jgi:hypothetical protein
MKMKTNLILSSHGIVVVPDGYEGMWTEAQT